MVHGEGPREEGRGQRGREVGTAMVGQWKGGREGLNEAYREEKRMQEGWSGIECWRERRDGGRHGERVDGREDERGCRRG